MNKPMLISSKPKLNENLPAPSWSPTGECGYWVWRDEVWSWLTDEEYEELKIYETDTRR